MSDCKVKAARLHKTTNTLLLINNNAFKWPQGLFVTHSLAHVGHHDIGHERMANAQCDGSALAQFCPDRNCPGQKLKTFYNQ
jgi:hypothetical protein